MKKIHISFYSVLAAILAVTIIVISFLISVCNDNSRKHKIAVILDNSQSSSWDIYKAGLNRAGEDYESEVYVVPTDDMFSTVNVVSLVKEQIEAGADGVIMQICDDTLAQETIAYVSGNTPVVLLDGSSSIYTEINRNCAYIGFDNTRIGTCLAEEVSKLYGTNIAGKKVGIVSSGLKQKSISDRMDALSKGLDEAGADIEWTYEYDNNESQMESQITNRLNDNPVDIVVALDNDCLEAVTKCKLESNKENEYVKLIGVGNSNKALYYLDTGVISALIVPNYFEMGYESVRELSEKLDFKMRSMESSTRDFRVVYRDTMFDESIQKYLYVVQ
ncbi:MAG: substrate-binding domain-containing protein [Butyrivibrio sp.]|nr:substrate-binding domain-containing protein [Butyrivibrio sp.]